MAKPWAQMTISEKLACLDEQLNDILWEEGYTQKAIEQPQINATDQERESARFGTGVLS